MWRSLVARFVRDEEVAGSNPVTPTQVERNESKAFVAEAKEGVVGPLGRIHRHFD